MTYNEAKYVVEHRHWFTYETYLLALDIVEKGER